VGRAHPPRPREAELARAERLEKELEAPLPGRFSDLQQRKRAALSAEQQAALAVPPMERTEPQQMAAAAAEAACS